MKWHKKDGWGRPDGVAGYLNTVTMFSEGILKKKKSLAHV
jgi:hypothetical protein